MESFVLFRSNARPAGRIAAVCMACRSLQLVDVLVHRRDSAFWPTRGPEVGLVARCSGCGCRRLDEPDAFPEFATDLAADLPTLARAAPASTLLRATSLERENERLLAGGATASERSTAAAEIITTVLQDSELDRGWMRTDATGGAWILASIGMIALALVLPPPFGRGTLVGWSLLAFAVTLITLFVLLTSGLRRYRRTTARIARLLRPWHFEDGDIDDAVARMKRAGTWGTGRLSARRLKELLAGDPACDRTPIHAEAPGTPS